MGDRPTARAAVLAAMAIAVGCGSSDSSEGAADVRRTVDAFYGALERKDGRRACAMLTARARREAEEFDRGGRRCARAIVVSFGGFAKPGIAKVAVDGDKATVELTGGEGGTASLVKDGDSWKLDAY